MSKYAIEDVISHRPPMILISRLIRHGDDFAECAVDIDDSSPFFQQELGGVETYIGIEYMAQSIAAFAGANALDKGEQVKIGFLLGSRRYEIFEKVFVAGNSYTISVKELYQEDSGLSVFDCKIELGEQLIAVAKVNVFQPEEPEEYIKEKQ